MKSNNIAAEIAEHGDNSPGCSLKLLVAGCFHGKEGQSPNIRQYMKSENPCEKLVSNSEPFPSILESAEQERRVERNREIEPRITRADIQTTGEKIPFFRRRK
jgi:hypothetical protein